MCFFAVGRIVTPLYASGDSDLGSMEKIACFIGNPHRLADRFCRQKRSAAKHLKISRCIYSKKYV